jgi:hypothetical protein
MLPAIVPSGAKPRGRCLALAMPPAAAPPPFVHPAELALPDGGTAGSHGRFFSACTFPPPRAGGDVASAPGKDHDPEKDAWEADGCTRSSRIDRRCSSATRPGAQPGANGRLRPSKRGEIRAPTGGRA